MALLSAAGCISLDQPGRYEPRELSVAPAPSRLSIDRVQWTTRGAIDDATRAFEETFATQLESTGLFAASSSGPRVRLRGELGPMCQPITVFNDPYECSGHESFGYSGMNVLVALFTFGAWPLVSVFGVPTDGGTGFAQLVLIAEDPETRVELARFDSGHVEETAYAGIYYSGSPMAESLAGAASIVIEKLAAELGALEGRVLAIERWREELSIARALEAEEPAIRARAVIAARAERSAELVSRVAARATDGHAVVRLHVVETLRVFGAEEAASRGALELLAKDSDSAVQYAATAAQRSLRFAGIVRAVRDPELAAIVARLESWETRAAALIDLRARGAAAAEARAALLFVLDGGSPADNREVVNTLLAIGPLDEELVAVLKKQAANGVREAELALAQRDVVVEKKYEPPPPSPTPVEVTPRPLVAVFTIEAKMLKAADRATMTEVFSALLTSVASFRVVPNDLIKERLTKSKLASYRACVDESCQIELGKALAAEKVLATKVLRQGTHCLTTATLYDLRTEASERASVAKSACTTAAITQALTTLANELAAPTR